MSEDLISVIEAAYRVDLSERDWLAEVTDASARVFDRGLGVCSYLYSFDASSRPEVSSVHCSGNFDPEWLKKWYARSGQGAQPVGNAPVGWSHWLGLSCASASQVRELGPVLGAIAVFGGARDVLSVNGRDPGGFGLRLGIPVPRRLSLAAKPRRLCERVAAHLAAGYRVRRALAERGAPLETAEAILSPGGELVHVAGEAGARDARAELRNATLRVDRARSARGRRDADAATQAWQGLVDARWTLLDHFDSDGKRFIVATRNDVALREPPPLTDRERQVLGFAALGHTNKEIAYELGLSAATVRVLVMRAARKLGVRGRVDAIARFRALTGGGVNPT